MEAQIFQADSRVREDIGKLAVKRGPIVYCAESVDNGEKLHLLQLLPEEEITETQMEIEGKMYPVLEVRGKRLVPVEGLYRKYQKPEYQDTVVKMIPYYTWANRGENEMRVWI